MVACSLQKKNYTETYFNVKVNDGKKKVCKVFDGHHFIIHKNEEIPMKTSKSFNSQVNETTIIII